MLRTDSRSLNPRKVAGVPGLLSAEAPSVSPRPRDDDQGAGPACAAKLGSRARLTCGKIRSPDNGRLIFDKPIGLHRDRGNCLACHQPPIPDEPMQGTVGPPLNNLGARLREGQRRLRMVDEQLVNRATIMPRFYARPGALNRPLPGHNTTILIAQEIEDVVACLKTLQ